MQRAIDAYFAGLGKRDMPTISGLARHLGFRDRHALSEYCRRDEFSATIKNARTRVEHALELRLFEPNPRGAIFNLKANFGWTK